MAVERDDRAAREVRAARRGRAAGLAVHGGRERGEQVRGLSARGVAGDGCARDGERGVAHLLGGVAHRGDHH